MSRLREKDPAKSPDKYAEQRMRDEEAQNDLRPDLEPEHAPANDRNEDDQREDPCVDGPVGSRVNLQNLMAVRKRSCVRPFYAATWPLAQMGSASNIQTQPRHIVCRGSSRILLLVGSTDHHLLLCP
ncbi:MAG: hypothetical protein B7Z57_14485 [Acidiphilium sp. 37-60-79]|nr:MAG: hypothetical protein B7Z57_14485 [Acidiphilium sp. 37-60-79]